jgi:cystathionine gamma-lyase
MTDPDTPGAADGPSTRALHAGLPAPEQDAPFLPGPVFASTYHFAGDPGRDAGGYGRDVNPTWSNLEAAIGALDGGECVIFGSGMAAAAAVLEPRLRPGDVLVLPTDGYYGIRKLAAERLEPRGIEVRFVPTDTDAVIDAVSGASLVWIETPSNPRLDVLEVRMVVEAAHGQNALVALDNTLATPIGQQPLALGCDFAMISGTKALSGHSDLLLGAVSVSDPALAAELRVARTRGGAIPGAFEAWLAHRSLATLGLRLERQGVNALALARMLGDRAEVRAVRYPGLEEDPSHRVSVTQMTSFGPVVGFELEDAGSARAFLRACRLVAEATSFGGVHSMAERRARWGGDDVPPGFVRFSCGIEDTEDLLADVAQALDRL